MVDLMIAGFLGDEKVFLSWFPSGNGLPKKGYVFVIRPIPGVKISFEGSEKGWHKIELHESDAANCFFVSLPIQFESMKKNQRFQLCLFKNQKKIGSIFSFIDQGFCLMLKDI